MVVSSIVVITVVAVVVFSVAVAAVSCWTSAADLTKRVYNAIMKPLDHGQLALSLFMQIYANCVV